LQQTQLHIAACAMLRRGWPRSVSAGAPSTNHNSISHTDLYSLFQLFCLILNFVPWL
jgi:hypothetical protein